MSERSTEQTLATPASVLDRVLRRVDGVRAYGPDRWMARCPAHPDRRPSLSIRKGDRGVLLHCFAGCAYRAILAALGLTPADLWGEPSDGATRQASGARAQAWPWRELANRLEEGAERLEARAEAIVAKAQGLHTVREWTEQDLDAAMAAVARAYEDLARAELLRDAAVELRRKGIARRTTCMRMLHRS
jgi:hypothetical protein